MLDIVRVAFDDVVAVGLDFLLLQKLLELLRPFLVLKLGQDDRAHV